MVEFEYVKGQEKRIGKKYDQLLKEAKILEKEGDIDRIQKKYQELLDKKKNGVTDWMDEVLISVYQDVLKIEEQDLKKI